MQTVAATVANHTLWQVEFVAVIFVLFAVAILLARRAAARRDARLRRAAGFGYQDHDVLERGLGPSGFGAVSATVTALATPLAPSFGSSGSVPPTPSLAPDFDGATHRALLPEFIVPEGRGDDRGPAPGWALPPELARTAAASPPTPPRTPAATPIAAEPPPGTAASWQPDPSGRPGLLRYWDGTMWTTRTTTRN